jgi:hypothetical protein
MFKKCNFEINFIIFILMYSDFKRTAMMSNEIILVLNENFI